MARERGAADIAERAALRLMGCDQVRSSEKEFEWLVGFKEAISSHGKIRVIFRAAFRRYDCKSASSKFNKFVGF